MSRPAVIFILVCALAARCAPPLFAADPLESLLQQTRVKKQSVRIEFPDAAVIPLVDAHNHLNADMKAEDLIAAMNRAGVRSMLIMPRHYRSPSAGGLATDEQALDFARLYPGRFIPFIGGQRDELGQMGRAWSDAAEAHHLLRGMEEKLKTGQYAGLGEFIYVHHAYNVKASGETGGEVKILVDHPLMIGIAKLGAKYGVPVLFHAEAEPDVLEQVHRLFSAARGTKFIWAHNCGRGGAGQVRGFLAKYPDLMCDLGHMHNGPRTSSGYGRYWPRKTPWVHLVMNDDGSIVPEMKALFEDFPDRFMIGADNAHTPVKKWYGYHMAIFRVMLAQLSPSTARRIAHENAGLLFAKPAAAK